MGRKGLNLLSLFKAGNLTIISLGAKGLKVMPKFHEGKGLNLSLIFYKCGKG